MADSVGPVVVGTDFSDTAGVALTEARRLAALLRTEVVVVHVADAPGAHWSDAAAHAAADEWLKAAGLRADGLVVRTGSAWVELARYASEVSPTLVVVGSHGRSGYQPLAMGSTASRVSLHARCPVVIVSPRVSPAATADAVQERRTVEASRAGAVAAVRFVPGNQ